MSLRKSKELLAAELKWIGKRVRYYLSNPLKKDYSLDGPYTGIVMGVSNDEAIIQDGLEGKSYRSSISFTGTLLVSPDDKRCVDDWVDEINADILEVKP